VDLTTDMEAACPPETLFAVLSDLGRYPEWLDIVAKAMPADPQPADGDGGPVWTVDLKAKIGPFSRTKRLRMVRTVCAGPGQVRFERAEQDGREHSSWVLGAALEPVGAGTLLTIHLHYGGSMFGGVVERVLRDEIERSKARLRNLVEA
jgi:Polyketide cyclase / dehydrase and lipid transport